jgi:hypothetical protein
LPLKVVDGHLLVRAVITNSKGDSNEVMLEIALEREEVLVLHKDQHEWLESGPSMGLRLEPDLQVSLEGSDVKVEGMPARERAQNAVSRFHSQETGETPVKGTLGAGFFRRYHVAIDVPAGEMKLSALGSTRAVGDSVERFSVEGGRMWLPVKFGGARDGRLLVGSAHFDTLVDSAIARSMGKPAGDVGSVQVGREADRPIFDLAQDVVFRPRLLAEDEDPGNDGAAFVSGVNLLEAFHVEIDWNDSQIAFTRKREARRSQADFELFQAQASGKPENISSWLQRNVSHRLSIEAAAGLMQWRIEEQATDAELMQALQWIVDTAPPARRMESCIGYVRIFAAMPGRSSLVQRAGSLALQHSRSALTAQDTYRLHNILGEALLKEGALTEAWKHFLSAAFMPLDNSTDLLHNLSVNLNLARVYDRQDRTVRAYSRYRKALALMSVKVRNQPALIEAAQGANNPSLTPEQRNELESLRGLQAEIESAMKRLRARIPADNAVLAEG